MSTDEDDEMNDVRNGKNLAKCNKFIDWSKFKRLFLHNKRIWKYFILYVVIYFSFRKYCAPWFKNPSPQIAATLSALDTDELMIQHVVGHDSHKVATNMTVLADSIAHLYLVSGAKYRNATTKQIVNSISNKNDETDNHLLDVHIPVWVFLLCLDVIHCIQNNRFTKEDLFLFIHHTTALITSSILKYKQKGGLFWCWIGFWSECISILFLLGSITRIYFQKRRPDWVWLRNVSDIAFGMSMFGFVYARVYLFPKVSYSFTTAWCKDIDNHMLTKAWFIFGNVLLQPIGWYWSFHIIRLTIEKIIETQKKK